MPATPLTAVRPAPSGRADLPAPPFDLAAIDATPDWRRGLAWPRAHPDSARLAEAVQGAVVAALARLPAGEARDIGVMMGGYVAATLLPLAEAAWLAVAERETGIRLAGAAPELEWLRGGLDAPPPRRGGRSLKRHAPPRWPLPRRIARTASWTPWPRLPLALLRPQAVALSHNALLIDVARRSGVRLGFVHGETLLPRGEEAPAALPEPARIAAEAVAAAALDATALPAEMRERLAVLVQDQCAWFAGAAVRDLARLRDARLPRHLWAGSGGYWPVRAVSLEVLRRGGTVTRFDHGGGTGLNRHRNTWALTDLAVSSRFFVATDSLARRVSASGAPALLAPASGTAVAGGAGDPHVAQVPVARAGSGARNRRTVLYGPGPLVGFRQVVPALLPDPVALDWQLRLVAALKALPVDLICRPHPEGLLRGRRHPVADLVPPAAEPFEALVARADVFVFDYVQSTTFYVALCTDRPIVLLQMGPSSYDGEVAEAIARRCRIVPVRFDDANLPQVDPAALEEAVCGGPDTADPAFFRAEILGEAR